MTFMEISSAFGFAFKSFTGLFNFESKGGDERMRNLSIAIGVLLLFGALYIGYRWYVVSREETVQKIFSSAVAEFNKAKTAEQLDAMAIEFKSGHDAYESSHLAPYFTAYEVDALLDQGKKVEALVALDSVISSLSSSNPLINLYKTKRALLKFDSEDAAIEAAGLAELQALAQDKKNKDRDMAQFYLGLYYFSADEVVDAKKVWVELVEQNTDAKNSSPWAEQAQEKLATLA